MKKKYFLITVSEDLDIIKINELILFTKIKYRDWQTANKIFRSDSVIVHQSEKSVLKISTSLMSRNITRDLNIPH